MANGPHGTNQRTGYLVVRNWETFQHYSKRNPPWIKLYTRLAHDDDYLALSPGDRVLLQHVWMLSAQQGNGHVRADQGSLRAGCRSPKGSLERLIQEGWLSVRASKPASVPLAPEYRPAGGSPPAGRTDRRSRASASASTTGNRNGKEPHRPISTVTHDDPPPADPTVAADAIAKLRAIATPHPIDPDDEEL